VVAGTIVDLGSGGGVPAFVILSELPDLVAVLVERGTRRAEFLEDASRDLGLGARVDVVCAEAEDAARFPDLEASAIAVTARSFAPPAVTAECATRFLRPQGLVLVSEPPDAPDRWDAVAMQPLGLVVGARDTGDGTTIQTLVRAGTPHPSYPRRAGTPRKRPLW
jgi:16S rRNA (guanine527-N7)-methyltransferase